MSNESKITLHAGVAHFLTHFYEIVFPALAIPLMLSLQMELAEVLKLGFFMYLLYGIAALPAGLVADRIGNHRSLVLFFLGIGTGSVLMALSSTPQTMTLSLAMIGLFASIYHPAGMGLLSACVRKRGMALGINGVAGNAGFVVAPFAAGVLNWLAGWQSVYLAAGGVAIVWGVLLACTDIDETPVHDDPAPTDGRGRQSDGVRLFIMLCVIMTLAGLAYRANTVILPAYIELKADFLWTALQAINLLHFSEAKTMAATFLTSVIFGIGMFGQLVGGTLSDRHDLRWLYFIFHGISLPFVILMAFLDQQMLIVAGGIYIFFSLGMQPIENSLVAAFTPARWRSTAYGIKFILTFGVGSLAVYCVALIQEYWSLEAVYLFVAGTVTLFLVLILLLIGVSRERRVTNNPATGPRRRES